MIDENNTINNVSEETNISNNSNLSENGINQLDNTINLNNTSNLSEDEVNNTNNQTELERNQTGFGFILAIIGIFGLFLSKIFNKLRKNKNNFFIINLKTSNYNVI